MPSYTYKCDYCQTEKDVFRTMSESDNPLTDEEFGQHKLSCEPTDKKYSKVFNKAPKKAYAAGWGSDRKGRYGGGWWE